MHLHKQIALTLAAVTLPAALCLSSGCKNGTLAPGVVPVVDVSFKTALCILDRYATDTAAGQTNWETVAVDIAEACGADVVQVASVVAGEKKVEAARLKAAATSDAGAE